VSYMTILIILSAAFIYFISGRKEVAATVLRTSGMLYQEQADNKISNMYNYEMVNKTFNTQKVELKIAGSPLAELKMVDRNQSTFQLGEDSLAKGSFFVIFPKNEIRENNSEIKLQVLSNGKIMDEIKTNFIGPVSGKK
ncbi:MAG: FixG Ig-like domain-containing protein, partial [Bacteroidia bacterium]